MSRIGKKAIAVPSNVTVVAEANEFRVKGPKGELVKEYNPRFVSFNQGEGEVSLNLENNSKPARALWGTYASHIRNMVKGVSEGYTIKLELVGVGYRAEVRGTSIVLNLGYSHPIEKLIPAGIEASVEKNVITLTGSDKEILGQFAADIRKHREPEPYKGKGIKYEGEVIRRKEGKKSV